MAERAVGVKMGDDVGGTPIVHMRWRPDVLFVRLPLVLSLHHKIQKMTSNNGGS